MMTRVLPVPAPAITSSGPCRCSTAARCGVFRVSGGVEGFMRAFHLSRAPRDRQGEPAGTGKRSLACLPQAGAAPFGFAPGRGGEGTGVCAFLVGCAEQTDDEGRRRLRRRYFVPLCSGSAGCEPALSGHRRDAGATGHQERAGELPAACSRTAGRRPASGRPSSQPALPVRAETADLGSAKTGLFLHSAKKTSAKTAKTAKTVDFVAAIVLGKGSGEAVRPRR